MPFSARHPQRLGWVFAGLVGATLALMVLGALVRAHGAGLACPDWPLCFGALVPVFDMRIALEWSHRLLAGSVSLGLLAGSVVALRDPAIRALLRTPLIVAWILLAVQVVLGGLTVLLALSPWTVTAHLLVGTAFCVTLLWIARILFEAAAPEPPERDPVSAALLGWLCLAGLLLVVQIGLGGMVSSHGAGLSCAAFPTCDGVSLAPTLQGPVGLQVLHRLNACGIFLAFLGLVIAARRNLRVTRLAWSALHLVILQIGVGALNVLARLPVEVTALHSAAAAALVLVTALLAREALASPRAVRARRDALESS
jgi:cytochrome c oxidase assembly protein subunit 15